MIQIKTFQGKSFGSNINTVGELVFTTSMTGYEKTCTDPSYFGQILVFTYPLVGNYGVPHNDVDEYGLSKYFESNKIHVKGVIISDYDGIYNHHNGKKSFGKWLKEHNIPALYGIDTRELVKIIRENGTVIASINNNCLELKTDKIELSNLVDKVSTKKIVTFNENKMKTVLIIDCGVKYSQIKEFLKRNMKVILVPWDYDFTQEQFDYLFISNGPGNPEDCKILIQRLREFMKTYKVPIFGICIGHQILSLAIGCKTYKMKYGNRGVNIPCNSSDRKCYITSQNHGYCVDFNTIPQNWSTFFENMNDNSNEGIYCKDKPYFSVQFHPESNPGPHDTNYLFDNFLNGEVIKPNIINSISSNKKRKVLILGSGGLMIGQSGEFDYSGSQAIKAFKEEGLTTVLINPNIATVQTSPGFADKVYYNPITLEYVTKVIKIERPDCISISFGGQTGLNCGIELMNVLKKYKIEILGTSIESIIKSEDRDKFSKLLRELNEKTSEGFIAINIKEALIKSEKLGYPLLVRASFALGGLGSGFVNNKEELIKQLEKSFSYSNQVVIDKSLKGWKEIEYEIVRDKYDNCVTVCNMENIDPLGVHTGDSIVIAPSQTLTDDEYNMLRETAIKVVKELNIVGECNIQYALDPKSKDYYIIEVNPRLSRSSALASKATGYPLAYVAAKLSLGKSLLELRNDITKKTAFFEPSLDYIAIKSPRWDLKKFNKVDKRLDSSMKSIGESMGISRNFEEGFQKSLRMAHDVDGFVPIVKCTDDILINPTVDRIFAIANGLYTGKYTVDRISELSGIDLWFIKKFNKIIETHKLLETFKILKIDLLLYAKKLGFSDKQIANIRKTTESAIRIIREKHNIYPVVKQIDTVAAEYPCYTNYLYTTYNGKYHDTSFDETFIIVLGSGVYKIGSSVEFDWCCVNAIRTLRELGEKVIMINCNPETVSTDYDEADKLYFDELSYETVMDIYHLEKTSGIILSMSGQIGNNIAMDLYKSNVKIIGTSPEMIDCAENRYKFSRMLDNLEIDQPQWKELTSFEDIIKFCKKSYPVLIRPSYVLSGASMKVVYNDVDLKNLLSEIMPSKNYSIVPIVVSKFIEDAKEIEVDAIAENGNVKLMSVCEHVENAGIHSGDATLLLPAQDVTQETFNKIKESTYKIGNSLNIHGPFNVQFIAKDDKVKVIECNVRVSRTFPFISKTFNVNFIKVATKIMMKIPVDIPNLAVDIIGCKVPVFSFNRLKGANINLGVDMTSTGEVACFGKNKYEAFIKGFQASTLKFPTKTILLSIGSYKFKKEFLPSAKLLYKMGYKLYGTDGTADYYTENGIEIEELEIESIVDKIKNREIEFVINILKRDRTNSYNAYYLIRRTSIDSSVSLIIDVKLAKLFVTSLEYYNNNNKKMYIDTNIDCFTGYNIIRLPGLIDVHVHIREPGNTYKGDWYTETQSALAGGITMVCVMPNTNPSITNLKSLDLILNLAEKKSHCDYGVYAGAGENKNINKLSNKVVGLKMYLNNTYGPLLLHDISDWIDHIKKWPNDKMICVHAESSTLPAVLHIANLYNKKIHVCHVARRCEIEIIRKSKENGQKVTCEVSPHHLFMNVKDLERLGCCGLVKPNLVTKDDQQSLWDNMDIIDCFATDHAPHTMNDKLVHKSPGFPGLETALPLLLTAVKQGRLSIDDIIEKYHDNPIKLFNLPRQENTYIEVDLDKEWIIPKKMRYSKCQWTPFADMKVYGLVRRVTLRGKVVYVDGEILAKPGYGRCITFPQMHQEHSKKMQKPNIVLNKQIRTKKKLGNILSSDDFNRDLLRYIFNETDKMKLLIKQKKRLELLKGKIMSIVFYEPSTRTRCSFAAAMIKLGGQVISITNEESSNKKGESLKDFMKTLENYSDLIVMRSSNSFDPHKGAKILNIPIINAGDSSNEHPTQSILDVYTIRNERGTLNGLTITIVGDLKYGRTVHSLVKLLSLYNVRLRYVSPKDLMLPQKLYDKINNKGIDQSIHTDLMDVLDITDVLYVTRIQKERFNNIDGYEKVKGRYKITPSILGNAKKNLVIMHPMPRIDEISVDLDQDPRSAYFRQSKNGLYVRMVLLKMILE